MLGGHGKVGEVDGEIRGLLVPRQTGSGVGEPGVAPTNRADIDRRWNQREGAAGESDGGGSRVVRVAQMRHMCRFWLRRVGCGFVTLSPIGDSPGGAI